MGCVVCRFRLEGHGAFDNFLPHDVVKGSDQVIHKVWDSNRILKKFELGASFHKFEATDGRRVDTNRTCVAVVKKFPMITRPGIRVPFESRSIGKRELQLLIQYPILNDKSPIFPAEARDSTIFGLGRDAEDEWLSIRSRRGD